MAKRASLLLTLGLLGIVVVWHQSRPRPSLALSRWTEVIALSPPPPGLGWTTGEEHRAVATAADGVDPEALRRAMEESGLRGLWIDVDLSSTTDSDPPLRQRFSAGEIVRGFRGAALTATGLLFVIDDTEWSAALADRVLARVARGILEGKTPPPLDAFPSELLRPQPVEVLVMLTGARGPRLWRSARSQSIADGVITASLAARERWEERMETMGGPLGERLEELDVHVAFLFDDGTFDADAVSLIDSLVKPRHGVAYEQPSRWRYLLPRATHNAESPTEAYRRLFRDNGLPEDSFGRRDLRLYRMRMQTVSVDQGSTGSR